MKSKPDGKTNLAFPQEYIKENMKSIGNMMIDSSEIKADSPWTAFIYTKNLIEPLKLQHLFYTENGRDFVGVPIDPDVSSAISKDTEQDKRA